MEKLKVVFSGYHCSDDARPEDCVCFEPEPIKPHLCPFKQAKYAYGLEQCTCCEHCEAQCVEELYRADSA